VERPPTPHNRNAAGPAPSEVSDAGTLRAASTSAEAPSRALAPSDAAESRQLTVLFCDLVGSTALSERLDPEDLHDVMQAYRRCCAERIADAGGIVAEYLGDGVVAYFGYPRAHENDAERAARAGLALIDAVKALAIPVAGRLQVRVGVATGVVVVGNLFEEQAAQDFSAVGGTLNLAARLQSLAEPDSVVIADATRRLAGGLFEYGDLGEVTLKGFPEPVQAWRLLGVGATESRFEARHTTTLTPLVGREEEIELLLRRWQQAKDGDGRVVLISGEAGIGKSRLAETVVDRIRSEPHARLRVYCSPHHQHGSLYPVITQLERAADLRRDDTNEQRLDKLETTLGRATDNLGEAVPLVAALLSVPTGERYPPLDLGPQKRKQRTLAALLAQIEGLAARQPVIIVVEDAHWIDPTTQEFLELVVDRVPSLPVLLVITFRPEFTSSWIGRSQVTLLALSRLPRSQRAEMLARVTEGKALPREIAEQIIDRTDGVPLFIEEMTKAVVESGVLRDAGDRYAATGPLPPVIPASLHASLLARLDRLGPVRDVAQIGAALGRSFSHELITAVASLPPRHVEDALTQLVSAELIFRRGSPPDAHYTFKHALVQDAAYSTLLRGRRHLLHARIVAVLEDKFPELATAQPELLAQHCAAGELTEKAIGYYLKAGQRGLARSAMTEAATLLSKGLDLLAGLADGRPRKQLELDLRCVLIATLMSTQGYGAPAVAETIDRARRLCEELDQPPQFASVLYVQCGHRIVRGELAPAGENADELRALGDARRDPVAKLTGCYMGALVAYHLGDFAQTKAYAEQVLQLYGPAHRARYAMISPDDPRLFALIYLSRALAHLGQFDQADRLCVQVQGEAHKLGHAQTLVGVLGISWRHYLDIGSSPAFLLGRVAELEALCAAHGFPYWAARAAVYRGWCIAALGREEEGLASITHGLAAARAAGTHFAVPHFLVLLAEARAKAGHPREGLAHLAEVARCVSADRSGEADLHRMRGELLAMIGERAAAEASFREAIAVARRQGTKLWELRAATGLARCWRDQGRTAEARALLQPILDGFTEGFETPVFVEAKAVCESPARKSSA
jgi:class 3 adenylate cyclase/predicted ATPase